MQSGKWDVEPAISHSALVSGLGSTFPTLQFGASLKGDPHKRTFDSLPKKVVDEIQPLLDSFTEANEVLHQVPTVRSIGCAPHFLTSHLQTALVQFEDMRNDSRDNFDALTQLATDHNNKVLEAGEKNTEKVLSSMLSTEMGATAERAKHVKDTQTAISRAAMELTAAGSR